MTSFHSFEVVIGDPRIFRILARANNIVYGCGWFWRVLNRRAMRDAIVEAIEATLKEGQP